MNRECSLCHGQLQEQQVTFTHWINGRLIVIERIPALVCESCGEIYYAPDVVERIQSLLDSDSQPDRVIEASVYDLPA